LCIAYFYGKILKMININKRKLFSYILLVALFFVIFGAGFYLGKKQVVCRVCASETVNFSLFWDAYNKIHKSFINPSQIDEQKIIYGAISGMLKSLGDPYTDFFDPKEAKLFQQDLSGSFSGIGAEIGLKKGQLTIIAPLKNTPGQKAGLKSGDQIIAIDEKSTFDMSIEEAINLIRGKKGTPVILSIFREGWPETKDIKIIRDTIKIESIAWELKEGNIAYINIRHFDLSLSYEFKKIAFEVLSSPAKKIVLDLRNNPGGYLEVSQDMAGWFLQDDQIVTIEDFGENKKQKLYKADGNAAFANYPTVVLINGGSASASEILAGALRDNRNITLIGEKSFGKGSVQEVITLQDNESLIKVTIAKWLTPKGNSIAEIGLEPDIKVEADDADPEKDLHLQKALEIIRDLH